MVLVMKSAKCLYIIIQDVGYKNNICINYWQKEGKGKSKVTWVNTVRSWFSVIHLFIYLGIDLLDTFALRTRASKSKHCQDMFLPSEVAEKENLAFIFSRLMIFDVQLSRQYPWVHPIQWKQSIKKHVDFYIVGSWLRQYAWRLHALSYIVAFVGVETAHGTLVP